MSVTVGDPRSALFERPATFDRGGMANADKAMSKKDISLADLPIGATATIMSVSASNHDSDLPLIQRLVEIGFIPGEKVKVIAHGHPGREPIAVRIGGATFGLRRFEADYVYVAMEK